MGVEGWVLSLAGSVCVSYNHHYMKVLLQCRLHLDSREPLEPAPAGAAMLYFQVVILAGVVMLAYYCEFTDTFSPAERGFTCGDPALTRPDPGPERRSAVHPVVLYSVVGGLPVVLISGVELVNFLLHSNSNSFYETEKVVVLGDCCYVNPMVRRTSRFLGVYVFGLFTADIFVNAGQLVTGSLAPYFLSACQPNETALDCWDMPVFFSRSDICTGDPEDIARARRTFPSKEAALSLYTGVYLAMYVMSCVGSGGGRLTGPLLSLSMVCVAVLTGVNRVSEYRNHWGDVITGQAIGGAIAIFLVVFVVEYFKTKPADPPELSDVGSPDTDEPPTRVNPRVEASNKQAAAQSPGSPTEVT